MIQVENIHKSFDGTPVLQGVSFEVKRGEILALIGRSGFGKSVTLKHVAGLMRPDQGEVIVDGHNLCCLKSRVLRDLRSRFGFLFQGGALFDSMTVYDNVAFPLREKTNLTETEIRRLVMAELEQVGLSGAENKYPAELSGGMIKRAALARALVREPELMLFDEPTTGLDPLTAGSILKLIDSCHQRLHFTGIIVTHEIPRIFNIVDKVAMLHRGRVVACTSPEEIMASPDPVVREFIHGGLDLGPASNSPGEITRERRT